MDITKLPRFVDGKKVKAWKRLDNKDLMTLNCFYLIPGNIHWSRVPKCEVDIYKDVADFFGGESLDIYTPHEAVLKERLG